MRIAVGALTSAAAVAAIVTVAALALTPKEEEAALKDLKTEAQVKADGFDLRSNLMPVELLDGGTVFESRKQLPDGGVVRALVATSPCAWRPARAPKNSCLRRLPDAGTVDFGDENVMQEGEWVGAGCQRVACSVWLGQDIKTGKFNVAPR